MPEARRKVLHAVEQLGDFPLQLARVARVEHARHGGGPDLAHSASSTLSRAWMTD